MAYLQDPNDIDTSVDQDEDDEDTGDIPQGLTPAKRLGPDSSAPKTAKDAVAQANSIGNGIVDKASSLPAGQKLGRADVSEFYNRMQDLVNDPQYKMVTPKNTQDTLREAMAKAHDAYQDQADKNDWMQVAQTLGRAVAQYGGAIAGTHSGHDMSALDTGAPIDYESRNRRALAQENQEVHDAQSLDAQDKYDTSAENQQRASDFARKYGVEKEGMNAAERGSALDTQAQRWAAMNVTRQKNHEDAQNRADQRTSLAVTSMNLKDLNTQEKTLSNQLKARQQLANSLETEDDLSPKAADSLKSKYAQTAAAAGVDLGPTLDQYSKANDEAMKDDKNVKHSTAFGINIPMTGKLDNSVKHDNLYGAMQMKDLLDQLQQVRSQKQKLLQGGASGGNAGNAANNQSPPGQAPDASTSSSPPDSVTPPVKNTVTIQAPDGTRVEVPRSKVDKYVSKGGKVVN